MYCKKTQKLKPHVWNNVTDFKHLCARCKSLNYSIELLPITVHPNCELRFHCFWIISDEGLNKLKQFITKSSKLPFFSRHLQRLLKVLVLGSAHMRALSWYNTISAMKHSKHCIFKQIYNKVLLLWPLWN